MKIYSHLIPVPEKGYVVIAGQRLEAHWVLETGARPSAEIACTSAEVIEQVTDQVLNAIIDGPVDLELHRGVVLIAKGKAYLDGTHVAGRLHLKARFTEIELL